MWHSWVVHSFFDLLTCAKSHTDGFEFPLRKCVDPLSSLSRYLQWIPICAKITKRQLEWLMRAERQPGVEVPLCLRPAGTEIRSAAPASSPGHSAARQFGHFGGFLIWVYMGKCETKKYKPGSPVGAFSWPARAASSPLLVIDCYWWRGWRCAFGPVPSQFPARFLFLLPLLAFEFRPVFWTGFFLASFVSA